MLLRYVLTEYDPNRPWIVVDQRHETVDLDDPKTFASWATEAWPSPKWKAELEPGQRVF